MHMLVLLGHARHCTVLNFVSVQVMPQAIHKHITVLRVSFNVFQIYDTSVVNFKTNENIRSFLHGFKRATASFTHHTLRCATTYRVDCYTTKNEPNHLHACLQFPYAVQTNVTLTCISTHPKTIQCL